MTHTPDNDTPALAEDSEPVVSRRALFHHIRMAVYRLAMTTGAYDSQVLERRGLVTRPALITELRDAVRPNQGGTGAGGSAPSTRIGFDAGAYDLYNDITAQISSAYESATERTPDGSTPEMMLLEWFIELEAIGRMKDGLSDAQLLTQRDRVQLWQARIEDHFNPPRTGDLPAAACIECQADRGYTLIDGHQVDVPAIYWTNSPIRGFHVHCRACGSSWTREELALRDRFKWALRRDERIKDLTAELTGDDWHHIKIDLREGRSRIRSAVWVAAAKKKGSTDAS